MSRRTEWTGKRYKKLLDDFWELHRENPRRPKEWVFKELAEQPDWDGYSWRTLKRRYHSRENPVYWLT